MNRPLGKSRLAVFLGVVSSLCGCQPDPPAKANVPWQDPKQQIELLNDSDYRIRALAAANLGRMGNHASEAIPHLEKLLNDPNEKVRASAQQAIEKIQPDEAGRE